MRKTVLGLALATLVAAPMAAQNERVDYDAIYKIKAEGLGARSQVMDTVSWLTDVHGPRLTNSPGMKAAAEWAKARLEQWGMANVQLAPWGPFGRGWENERLSINMIAPRPFEILGYPKAWSPAGPEFSCNGTSRDVGDPEGDSRRFEQAGVSHNRGDR